MSCQTCVTLLEAHYRVIERPGEAEIFIESAPADNYLHVIAVANILRHECRDTYESLIVHWEEHSVLQTSAAASQNLPLPSFLRAPSVRRSRSRKKQYAVR